MIWYFKQLLPLTYYSVYHSEGKRHFHIWKMWFGKCYNQVKFNISE